MRLKNLKVSGFKSFVDITDIRLPGDLVGVVGPNGCGKSNVIDAVRWVMGEASAKMLRGDNMADVIFNGSSSRKPVGKASVELIFDNNDGKAGGNYAQFAEISIKRTLSRDGQSNYSINNIKSRRKDVLDLFRGTGLGPRSYSIIEQGMVSRIVEARPDDLRAFVEEAAGTSRYKDRRRETEIRINHTRENLDRVADIRDELDKQLRRLQRQSAAARRYKVLRQEERLVAGQLHLLRLQSLEKKLAEQDRITAQHENALEEGLAQQRSTEAELERLRKHQTERQEANSLVQQNFYSIGAEIKNTEQKIEHITETRQRQGQEIDRLKTALTERRAELESDNKRLQQYQQDIVTLEPEVEALNNAFQEAEQARTVADRELQQWQSNWETFNQQSQEPLRQQEVQRSRINQLQQQLAETQQRSERLAQQLQGFEQYIAELDIEALRNKVGAHDQNLEQKEHQFQGVEQSIQLKRDQLSEQRDHAGNLVAEQKQISSRLRSLKEIQSAALGDDDAELKQWLQHRGIDSAARLAQGIVVKDGWERAADRVLSNFTSALCLHQETDIDLNQRPKSGLSLLTNKSAKSLPAHSKHPRLIDRVEAGDIDLQPLLADIYIADTLDQAISMQDDLFGRDCIVTKDGTLLGANWVSFASESQMETGVLVREEEIKQLSESLGQLEPKIADCERQIATLEQERNQFEVSLQQQRAELNRMRTEKTSLHNQLGREEARFVEVQQRSEQVGKEIEDLKQRMEERREQIEQAQSLLEDATALSSNFESRRDELLSTRQTLQQNIGRHRDKVSEIRDRRHQKQLQKQRIDSATESVQEHLKRVQQQHDATEQRLGEINNELTGADDPIESLNAALAELLEKHLAAEELFTSARDEMGGIENQIAVCNQNRIQQQQQVNQWREQVEQQKLRKQEVLVRKNTQQEQADEQGHDMEALLVDLPEQADINVWQENLQSIEKKIERIGPVNLVAIEEFEEQSERKEYLDTQHADLTEALETLESVIRKIDRETRSRFKETFDKLNLGFNDFFPQLFGGGKAELQLTSDDYLTAGVLVMARPPGKRNSTIHLLSGGEKALTAVALLFSLFRLNPAPFCMLDEVDAPLDDANVDRYCRTLRQLSEISQIIVITHNKITMEAADNLVGVTMAEPGVSRLVSVDIGQAVEMATQ